jgi:hypothetical protein
VLEIAPKDAGRPMLELGMQGGPLHKKYKIYLDHVSVAHVPENYEDRLTEISPKVFKHLRLLALDPYDLALSKLERNIQRDRDDVMHLARTVPFDLEVLKERYQQELPEPSGAVLWRNPQRAAMPTTLIRTSCDYQLEDQICFRFAVLSIFEQWFCLQSS